MFKQRKINQYKLNRILRWQLCVWLMMRLGMLYIYSKCALYCTNHKRKKPRLSQAVQHCELVLKLLTCIDARLCSLGQAQIAPPLEHICAYSLSCQWLHAPYPSSLIVHGGDSWHSAVCKKPFKNTHRGLRPRLH